MSEQDTLLDVVVNIKPNNDINAALNTALKSSLESAGRTLQAFNLGVQKNAQQLMTQLQQVIAQFNTANAAMATASRNASQIAAQAATAAAAERQKDSAHESKKQREQRQRQQAEAEHRQRMIDFDNQAAQTQAVPQAQVSRPAPPTPPPVAQQPPPPTVQPPSQAPPSQPPAPPAPQDQPFRRASVTAEELKRTLDQIAKDSANLFKGVDNPFPFLQRELNNFLAVVRAAEQGRREGFLRDIVGDRQTIAETERQLASIRQRAFEIINLPDVSSRVRPGIVSPPPEIAQAVTRDVVAPQNILDQIRAQQAVAAQRETASDATRSLLQLRNAATDALGETRKLLSSSRGLVSEGLQGAIQQQIETLKTLRTEVSRTLQTAKTAPESAMAATRSFRTQMSEATATGMRLETSASSEIAQAKQVETAARNTTTSLKLLENAAADALTRTQSLLSSSRGLVTEGLQTAIQKQIEDLRTLRTEIARTLKTVEDAPDVAAAALPGFRSRISGSATAGDVLGSRVSEQAKNRAEMERLMADFRQAQQKFAIEERLSMSKVRGLPSATARTELAQGKAQIATEIQAVMRLRDEFDGSTESVNRLKEAIERLSGTTDTLGRPVQLGSFDQQLGLIEKSAKNLPVSMNTLRNDFYQLGQAFEDAGIGYELNGWPGAIRGASNNVLFLVNSLTQMKAVEDGITSGLTKMFRLTADTAKTVVPLALGFGMVGISIATVILPRMVEWLESLNDIDYKMKDLGETLRRSFAAQDFTIDLRIGEAEFRRQLQDLESVEDVLRRIRDLEAETADNALRMREQMRGMFALSEFEDTLAAFEAIVPAFDQVFMKQLSQATERQAAINDTRLGFLRFTPSEIVPKRDVPAAFEELKQTQPDLFRIQKAIENIGTGFEAEINGSMRKGVTLFDQLSESFEKGSFNATQIRNVASQLRVLQEAIPTLPLDAADEKTAENYTNTIAVLINRLEELGNAAEKNASKVGKNLTDAMDIAIRKTAELADRQALLRMQLLGMADEGATFLLDFRDAVVKYSQLVQQEVAFARSQGVPEPQVIEFEQTIRRQGNVEATNNLLQEQVRIADQIKKKEQELSDLVQKREDRRSKSIQLEAYLRQLQENALSPDVSATKDNTAAIRALTRELENLRSQQEKTRVLEDLVKKGQADRIGRSATAMALLPGQMQSAAAFGSAAGAGMMGLGPLGGLAGAVGVEALAPVFDRVGIEIVRAVNNTTSAIQQTGKVPARTAP